MKPSGRYRINQSNIVLTVPNAKQLDIIPAVRLIEYQKLMLQFSESILLHVALCSTLFSQMQPRHNECSATRYAIGILKNLQDLIVADLQALECEESSLSGVFID